MTTMLLQPEVSHIPHPSFNKIDNEIPSKVSQISGNDLESCSLGDNPTIWVFGYGSLLWKPDFPYRSKEIGYIEGYARRFEQGNETFRGRPGQPGRVANLVEQEGSRAWGVAYEICGHEEVNNVLKALNTREKTCGGYCSMMSTFYPRESQPLSSSLPASFSFRDDSTVSEVSNENMDISEVDESECSVSLPSRRQFSDLNNFNKDSPDSGCSSYCSKMSTSDDDVASGLDIQFEKVHLNLKENRSLSSSYSSSYESLSESDDDEFMFQQDRTIIAEEEISNKLSHNLQKPDTFDRFRPRNSESQSENKEFTKSRRIEVLLFTVTSENDLYLGSDDFSVMAKQIAIASGSTGTNVEYVTKIADYVREFIPEDDDLYLFALDAKVREEVHKLKRNIHSV